MLPRILGVLLGVFAPLREKTSYGSPVAAGVKFFGHALRGHVANGAEDLAVEPRTIVFAEAPENAA